MKAKSKNIETNWRVGLIPSIGCAVGIYILTRWYFNDGRKEGLEMIRTTIDIGNEIQRKIGSKYCYGCVFNGEDCTNQKTCVKDENGYYTGYSTR